eukprot:scaffold919_cov153-Ochromonas_danica.AAC.18
MILYYYYTVSVGAVTVVAVGLALNVSGIHLADVVGQGFGLSAQSLSFLATPRRQAGSHSLQIPAPSQTSHMTYITHSGSWVR